MQGAEGRRRRVPQQHRHFHGVEVRGPSLAMALKAFSLWHSNSCDSPQLVSCFLHRAKYVFEGGRCSSSPSSSGLQGSG